MPDPVTARDLLIEVLLNTPRGYLDHTFGEDAGLDQIADHILTSRDEETLNAAADDYEDLIREQNPGVILGAIRRIRAYKVGAFLRARADTATGFERTTSP